MHLLLEAGCYVLLLRASTRIIWIVKIHIELLKMLQVWECFFEFWLSCWPIVILLEKFRSHLEGIDKHKCYNVSAAKKECLNILYFMVRVKKLPAIFMDGTGTFHFSRNSGTFEQVTKSEICSSLYLSP